MIEGKLTDIDRHLEWTALLRDAGLACQFEIAAVLAANQMGVSFDPADR